jgi:hypothetical protein
MTVQELTKRHGQAIRDGDVDGVLVDYADESVIMWPGRVARGLAEIRDVFTDLLPTSFRRGARSLSSSERVGRRVRLHGLERRVGDTGLPDRHGHVRRGDDKIVFQTFVPHTVDK